MVDLQHAVVFIHPNGKNAEIVIHQCVIHVYTFVHNVMLYIVIIVVKIYPIVNIVIFNYLDPMRQWMNIVYIMILLNFNTVIKKLVGKKIQFT